MTSPRPTRWTANEGSTGRFLAAINTKGGGGGLSWPALGAAPSTDVGLFRDN